MDRYAVIGHPVEHSLSPKIHGLFARQTSQTLTYDKLPAPADGFVAVAEHFFAAGGKGLNVTLPFKGVAADWVQERDAAAEAAGAVNTIAVRSGRYLGYNTDGVGLIRDLRDNEGCVIAGKVLLVLGAGGAVNGVIRPLLGLLPASLTLANRSAEKAQALTDMLRSTGNDVEVHGCGLDELHGQYDVVINATSAGLSGRGDLVAESAVRGAFCYDLLYASQPGTMTPFCRWAASVGAAQACDGLGMLVEQAAEAFSIWRGVRPATAPVLAELRRA